MGTYQKYAAIDVGSNAIRLLIATVFESDNKPPLFKKTSLVRVPIRLGADVFLSGAISEANAARMQDAFQAFSLLIKTHKVVQFRACATSAMREATNGPEIAKRLEANTGIPVHIIDGKEEARLIAGTNLQDLLQAHKVFLYVDVGGGSTEFTLYANGKIEASMSFPLGTVRILNNSVSEAVWKSVKKWIKTHTKPFSKIEVIGSGGNINSIYRHSGKKAGKPLSYFFLSNFYEKVRALTFEDRVYELQMNPDRADVIVPATRIYLSAMKWSKSKNIYVPKIGLSDGIVKALYQESCG